MAASRSGRKLIKLKKYSLRGQVPNKYSWGQVFLSGNLSDKISEGYQVFFVTKVTLSPKILRWRPVKLKTELAEQF